MAGWTGPRAVPALVLGGLAVAACGPSPEYFDRPEDAHDVVVVEDEDEPREATVGYASVLGRWRGMGVQSDGARWLIELDVANLDAGPCAVVRYPTIGCSGYWVCPEPSDGSRIEAVERITEGRGHCSDQVAVKVALANDHGSLCYFADDGQVTASGKLRGR
ncbi:MAG: hypothetical protein JRI68_31100 [Deltaproteobacteria bacterium]|nr:hypothetical protein [Deltaproteobacteria bacterium]